MGRWWKIKVN
jgi:hypothetical protein